MTSYNIRPQSKICSSFSSKLHFAFCFFSVSARKLKNLPPLLIFLFRCLIYSLHWIFSAFFSTHTFFFQEILGLGQQTSQQPGRNHKKRVSLKHPGPTGPGPMGSLDFIFFLASPEYYIKVASIFPEGFSQVEASTCLCGVYHLSIHISNKKQNRPKMLSLNSIIASYFFLLLAMVMKISLPHSHYLWSSSPLFFH